MHPDMKNDLVSIAFGGRVKISPQTSILIDLKMPLNPVHSGSPLFNSRQEVVGMVLMGIHAKAAFPVKGTHHFAIPLLLLEKALKASKIDL